MKKKLLFVPLIGMLLAGCSVEDLMFWKKKDAETGQNESGKSTPEDGGGQKPELDTEYKITISLAGETFCSEMGIRGTGYKINDSDSADHKETFKTYLSSKLRYDGLLTSIACSELNTAPYGSSFCLCAGTRNDSSSSGFDSGIFTWNSSKTISKVELKARGYYKELGAKDVNAHIKIDEEDYSLEYDASSEPEFEVVSKDYSDGVESFTLSSLGGRVMFEEISITWRV